MRVCSAFVRLCKHVIWACYFLSFPKVGNQRTCFRPFWTRSASKKCLLCKSDSNKLQLNDVVFLACDAVCIRRQITTFRKSILSAYSTLKMETLCVSETLVSVYESTWCHNPEEHLHTHRSEKFRSRTFQLRLACSVDFNEKVAQLFSLSPGPQAASRLHATRDCPTALPQLHWYLTNAEYLIISRSITSKSSIILSGYGVYPEIRMLH